MVDQIISSEEEYPLESSGLHLPTEKDTREQLLRAGIIELHEKGIDGFSIRRVASMCGISCAAPYRHFKNKEDFIAAIFGFITRRWYMMQNVILSEYSDVRDRITEICLAYVRFLVDNPDYYRILMVNAERLNMMVDRKDGLSSCVRGLIANYCAEVNMDDESRIRKTFIVRSLILGTTMMILSGDRPDSEETMELLRNAISREFELN